MNTAVFLEVMTSEGEKREISPRIKLSKYQILDVMFHEFVSKTMSVDG